MKQAVPSESRSAADVPVRIAIIGAGFSGRRIHAPVIEATPGCEVVAFVTHSTSGRQELQASWPEVDIVDDLVDLPTGIDAVVIATPDSTHVELAQRSLDLGFPTVVDKPLAVSAAAARGLLDTAVRKGLLLTGFQNRRWDGDFLTVRSVLDAGRVGDPIRFESAISRWAPSPGSGWRDEPASDGFDGLLAGVGTHLVDQAIVLFGPVAAVYGEVEVEREGARVNDDIFLALRHHSGVRSHLVATSLGATARPRFRLQGRSGGYFITGDDPQQGALTNNVRPGAPGWGEAPDSTASELTAADGTSQVAVLPGDWRYFYTLLRAALLDRGPTPVDPNDIVHSLDVLAAASRSAATGTVVEVKEQAFTDVPVRVDSMRQN